MGSLDSIAGAYDYVCPFGVLNCPRHPPDAPEVIVPGLGHYNPKPVPGKQYSVVYLYGTPGEYYRPITYKLHRYSEEDLLKLNNYSRVKAYYGNREFYQPDYDKEMIIPKSLITGILCSGHLQSLQMKTARLLSAFFALILTLILSEELKVLEEMDSLVQDLLNLQ